MLRQISANFKRRLLQFIKNSKEIVLNVQMVVFILIQVVFLQTILQLGFRIATGGQSGQDVFSKIQEVVLQLAFPGLVQISIVMSSSLFVVTPVQDREEKLRYLLNFSGISSFTYYVGLFLADMILFMIPCILVLVLSYLLNIESFYKNTQCIMIALFLFGLGFI